MLRTALARVPAASQLTTRSLASAAGGAQDRVVLVDGCRTPFHPSGTHFQDYIGQQLGRFAIKGLLSRTGLDPSIVDYVVYGTVIQEGEVGKPSAS
jgi:acetyl-CoA acyltransferase